MVHNEPQICSAAIISKHFAITSAQCVHNLEPNTLHLRVGTTKLINGGKKIRVNSVIIHGNFTKGNVRKKQVPKSDVALLAIKSGLKFNRSVNSVNLSDILPDDFEEGIITGWSSGTYVRRNLLWKNIPIVDMKSCNNTYKKRLQEDQFCAGFGNADLTTCQNEMGNPLVVEGQLLGILTIPAICQRPIKPEVFIKVSYYLDWATEEMDNWYEKEGVKNPDSKDEESDSDSSKNVESGDKDKNSSDSVGDRIYSASGNEKENDIDSINDNSNVGGSLTTEIIDSSKDGGSDDNNKVKNS